MMRTMIMILGVFCTATVMSVIMGAGLLWYRGQLTMTTIKEVRLVLTGEDQIDQIEEDETNKVQQSHDELAIQRTMRAYGISSLEARVSILAAEVDKRAERLEQDLAEFATMKKEFKERLAQLDADITGEAVVQLRSVLLNMKPADAADYLATREIDDAVTILKDMPEKKIASIMKQFAPDVQGPNSPMVEQGYKILEGIGDGDPKRTLVDETNDKLLTDAASKQN